MTLVQEHEDVCPGDTVTLTCSVNTSILRWQNGIGSSLGAYYSKSSPGDELKPYSGFVFNLTNKSGNMLTSTATLSNASESVTLMCTDGAKSTEKSNIVVIQSRLYNW